MIAIATPEEFAEAIKQLRAIAIINSMDHNLLKSTIKYLEQRKEFAIKQLKENGN